MKVVAAIILMLLFSVQTFSKWMWVFDYQLNKTYIAQNLCINKAKPMQHCNGSCQLTKQLAEDESSNKTSNQTTAKQNAETAFLKTELQVISASCDNQTSDWPLLYLLKTYTVPRTPLFHPPGA